MHDDVDAPETFADSSGDDGAAFGGRDVSGDELIRMIGPFGPRPGGGEDGRARFAQGRHDRLADPLRAARDERAFSLELQVIGSSVDLQRRPPVGNVPDHEEPTLVPSRRPRTAPFR